MSEFKEIKISNLNLKEFIEGKIEKISEIVGKKEKAITALSGGVDSSVVTMLGSKALSARLKVYFIDNGLMRENEPEQVASIFKKLGVTVEVIEAKEEFFTTLKGISNPEQKREAITQAFYKNVFRKIIESSGARYLLQGTILTDIEETVAGIKRQHNIFEQIGIDPEKEFGYRIIEPLIEIRKDSVRKVAKALGLPEDIYNRMPFPGPALAARVIGEVTLEKIKIIREATTILEGELKLEDTGAFQYMAILHEDKVTGMRDGKRDFGYQIELRCWDSIDARIATPTELSWDILKRLSKRIATEVPGVVSITYNITTKPPSTMEAI